MTDTKADSQTDWETLVALTKQRCIPGILRLNKKSGIIAKIVSSKGFDVMRRSENRSTTSKCVYGLASDYEYISKETE